MKITCKWNRTDKKYCRDLSAKQRKKNDGKMSNYMPHLCHSRANKIVRYVIVKLSYLQPYHWATLRLYNKNAFKYLCI